MAFLLFLSRGVTFAVDVSKERGGEREDNPSGLLVD